MRTVRRGGALVRGVAIALLLTPMSVVAASLTPACELFYPLDDLPIVDDSGAVEAADTLSDLRPEAANDGPSGSPNLVPNGDFEMNTGTACTGWGSYQGTVTASSTAHGGNSACLICSKVSGVFSGGVPVLSKPVPAGTYVGTAWVKAAGGRANSLQATLNMRVFCDPPTPTLECYHGVTSVPFGDAYRKVGPLTFVVPDGGRGPQDAALGDMDTYVSVDNGASPGDCFLVDDVVVERLDK